MTAATQAIETERVVIKMVAGKGIYVASKTVHARRWLQLRLNRMPIISTWIDEAGEGQSADLHDLWDRCLSESSRCSALVAYREPGEVFKGGWVEIGAALVSNVPVHAVGLEEFTIAKYRGITHHKTIEAAFEAAMRDNFGFAQP